MREKCSMNACFDPAIRGHGLLSDGHSGTLMFAGNGHTAFAVRLRPAG